MEQKSRRKIVKDAVLYTFRSEVYFDNDNRLTGTAAKVIVYCI